MKEIIRNVYRILFKEDLVQQIPTPCPIHDDVIPFVSNGEKLYKLAMSKYGIDPTPKDEVADDVSCVFSLTTILKELLPDFPTLNYTPTLLVELGKDRRFQLVSELKTGNIVVFPTLSGNNKIMGHCFIVGIGGKMLSNSSSTGLWDDKYDTTSMIDRYARTGQLRMYIFELV